ncbi:MAG: hypothetical protein B7Y45_12795 [Sphingomonas sp. 28-66-16]|nr:MAG: hypothetical protein B7Y45_12795 [Sphingomonas sp. 28-66-16]
MDARNIFSPSLDGLLGGDWRQSGAGPAPATAAAPAARKSTLGPAALHVGARRASFAQERNRAREIVSEAKLRLTATFEDARFGHALKVDQLWPLVSGINASIERHPAAIMGVTRLRDRHEYSYLHSVAVCGLMIDLARRLRIDPTLHHDIGLAGLLHDIGKSRVPTMLLDKPSALTEDERVLVSGHAQWGYEMLIQGEKLPEIVLDVCLHHHERLDGSGYPDHKKGESISIYARMAAICDVYDAVTSVRVYKRTWSPAEALEWMVARPSEFDPAILGPFSAMIGVFPVGSLVRLQSNRLAIVLDDPEGDPMAPPVCPIFCIQSRQMLPAKRLQPGLDPILGLESPGRWSLPDWGELRAARLAQFDLTDQAHA